MTFANVMTFDTVRAIEASLLSDPVTEVGDTDRTDEATLHIDPRNEGIAEPDDTAWLAAALIDEPDLEGGGA